MATVSFRVTGANLTKSLRDMVLSGRWQAAFDAAAESFGHAVDLSRIRDILAGKTRLIDAGDGLSLAPEEADVGADYRSELMSVYGGGYLDRAGGYWKPYAVIDNYGQEDTFLHVTEPVLASGSDLNPSGATMIADGEGGRFFRSQRTGEYGTPKIIRPDSNPVLRALWYANSKETDRGHIVSIDPALDERLGIRRQLPKFMTAIFLKEWDMVTLWAAAPSPPPFLAKWARTPQDAFDQALEIGLWPEVRGHRQRYASMTETDRNDEWFKIKDRQDRIASLDHKPASNNMNNITVHILNGDIGPGDQARDHLFETRQVQDEAIAKFDVAAAQAAILAKAADIGGFLNVATPPDVAAAWPHLGPLLAIPAAPLENWALWRTNGACLAPRWAPVAPSGWKCLMDDPYHTDWMIGAGFTDPHAMDANRYVHDDPVKLRSAQALLDLADQLKTEIQKRHLGAGATLLSGGGVVTGRVEHARPNQKVSPGAIAVIPNAGPDYLDAALSAAAVVTEVGGAMAHLANIGRECHLLIVRVENARKRLKDGMDITVDGENRQIKIEEGPWRGIEFQCLPDDDGWRAPDPVVEDKGREGEPDDEAPTCSP